MFLILGLVFLFGGFFLIFAIIYSIVSINIYLTPLWLFFGLGLIALSIYRWTQDYMFILTEFSWFLLFAGLFELYTHFYAMQWVSYSYYIGWVSLLALSRSKDDRDAHVALVSLYVLGLVLTLLTALGGIFLQATPSRGILELSAQAIVSLLSKVLPLEISIGKDFWITEQMIFGITSIYYVGYVTTKRKADDYRAEGILKYAGVTAVGAGLLIVTAAIVLPTFYGYLTPIVAAVIGIIGIFIAYSMVNWMRKAKTQRI